MKRVTLLNALKVIFAVYAVYCAIVGVYSLIRFSDVLSWPLSGRALLWFWAVFSLCLLPVAWGLAREKKWAWNAGMGLMLFGLVVGALNMAGVCFVLLQDTVHKNPISPHLRSFAVGSIKSLALLTLFILARRSYRTAFGAVPTGTESGTELKRNSYVRPVALGVLFLMIGGLMLLHPISGKYSPTIERVVALVFTGILGAGAPLCFFERRAKVVRRLAIFAIVTAVAGLAVSMTMYTYFAIEGLCVSGVQLVVSIAALVTARKAWQSFID